MSQTIESLVQSFRDRHQLDNRGEDYVLKFFGSDGAVVICRLTENDLVAKPHSMFYPDGRIEDGTLQGNGVWVRDE